jgi:large subunit ribosomal protein L10
MPRPEKVEAVAEIRTRLEQAQAVFLAEYAGLSVKEQQTLRRELRANAAEFKVVKMTLARRAAAELDIDEFDDLLLGPTGIAFADGDPVNAAKAMRDFAKTHEVFEIKGGMLGREFLTPERIAELANVEPREVLLAKLAGALQAPIANMAGLLAALPRNAATALQQLLEKKEQEQGTPEEEPASVEDAAADPGETTAAAEEPQPEAGDPTTEAGSDTESEIQAGAEASPEDAEPEPAEPKPEPASEPEDADNAADAAAEE